MEWAIRDVGFGAVFAHGGPAGDQTPMSPHDLVGGRRGRDVQDVVVGHPGLQAAANYLLPIQRLGDRVRYNRGGGSDPAPPPGPQGGWGTQGCLRSPGFRTPPNMGDPLRPQ